MFMLSIVRACAIIGLEGEIVLVETDFNPRAQLPIFTIVGLPDSAVKESRERVRAAIKNSGLQFPNKGYTVNLSPADMLKQGPVYDLPIAVGVLAATDQIPLSSTEGAMFIGELSLDGSVRHARGVLAAAYTALQGGLNTLYCAVEDAPQAALIAGMKVIPVPTLAALVEHLYKLKPLPPFRHEDAVDAVTSPLPEGTVDFADIKGQEHIKRALEIAAGGNHNILMSGSPGVGKTLLARAVPGILPQLDIDEALEVTRIYSVADLLTADQPLVRHRPFRAPHHTTSLAGLIGGGSIPKPGEVTLAHRGVLFIDEFPELATNIIDSLRQPIEDKIVTISRAKASITLPANFLLIGAMNPCPCGYYGDTHRPCTCTPTMITRYQSRLSGPLLDRIDLHLEVPRVDHDKLMSNTRAEPSEVVRARVEAARQRQRERFAGHPHARTNSDMTVSDIQTYCPISSEAKSLLEVSIKRMNLSARAYHRVLKLSRTIADLSGSDIIQMQHTAEALQYRPRQAVY
jgi:magnesium chelatase family protein